MSDAGSGLGEGRPSQPLPPAGWYPDPHNPQATQRYWDGSGWTDSYAPIGTPIVDPADPPKPLASLQAVATAGLSAVILAQVFNIVADANYIGVLGDMIDGRPVSQSSVADAQDLIDGSTVAVSLGLVLVGPATFLPWFYSAYVNLRRFGLRNLRYTPGWAIGSWFIPVFNLFRPKQIANDLDRATGGGELHSVGRIDSHPVNPLLHWWWAVYLLGGAIGFFAGSAYSGDDPFASGSDAFDTLEDERAFYVADLVASSVTIVAALLAILVVRKITADQRAVLAEPAATLHTYVSPPA